MGSFHFNLLITIFGIALLFSILKRDTSLLKSSLGFLVICLPILYLNQNIILVPIAGIILFQKELKTLIHYIGSNLLFFIKNKKHHEINEAIYDSLLYMAKFNCGAILIIKQNDLITDCSDGIPINGIVSTPLILSVFNEYSPLHDGAVLIEDDSLATARLILPLSNNEKLNKYGTRHRAAMGLSEICDAKIFVVSEETGTISYFHNRQFKPNVSQTDLKRIIAGI